MKIYDKVFHLSHNDLDGYASQFAMTFSGEDITFFNSSYEEVGLNINLIIKKILSQKEKKILFLITDVSLNEEQVLKLNNFKRGNKNINLDIQLLDHHKSNQNLSEKNNWYFLDMEKCATLLTCEYVINNFKISKKAEDYLMFLGDFVDSHDRWLENHKYHTKSNFLSDCVYELEFPDFLKEYKRDFIFSLINKISLYFKETFFSKYIFDNKNIQNCEKYILNIYKNFLKNKIPNSILEDKNLKINHKIFYYFTILFEKLETKTYYLFMDGRFLSFKIFYNLNSTIFQYLSHYYLERNKNIDFCISVKSSGSLSFRSKDPKNDVSLIAKTYFDGGGHACASGGNFKKYGLINSIQDFEKILISNLKVEIKKEK